MYEKFRKLIMSKSVFIQIADTKENKWKKLDNNDENLIELTIFYSCNKKSFE